MTSHISISDLVYDQVRRTCSLASVLDVGCGAGQLVYKLLETGSDAYGVELDHSLTANAAGWTPSRFIQADAALLPFTDVAFETVVASHLLDSLPAEKLPEVLNELNRVCRRFLFALVSARSTSLGRGAWDRLFIEHGFCRLPRIQDVVPFGTRSNDDPDILLVYEKIPEARRALQPELGFHMDMLRETGPRADAYIARYHLASSYVRPGDVVVDTSCGPGYGCAILADGSLASQVIGLDEHAKAIAYAKAVFAAARSQVEFHHDDLSNLRRFPDGSVDVVVSLDTLQPLPDPETFLAEAFRILTPGGRFVVSMRSKDPAGLAREFHSYFLPEQVYGQSAKGLFEIHDGESSAGAKPELFLIIAAKDPRSGKREDYRETVYSETAAAPPNLTAYARDYDNPWLVRSLVHLSSRFRSAELLETITNEIQQTARGESADLGAALCVEGYQLTRHTTTPRTALDTFMAKAASYLTGEPESPHAYRWHISLRFLAGRILLLTGRRNEALDTFKLLAEQDVVRFSPLLGTKTINAAFYSGWLSSLDGDIEGARSAWERGVRETHRLLQGDWQEVWGNASNPLPFALPEIADIVDAGSRCAIGLKYTDRLKSQPGLFVRLMEQHSKELQAESTRLRAFEQSMLHERAKEGLEDQHRGLKTRNDDLASCLAMLRAWKENRPVYIWGAGSLGTQLEQDLRRCGIRLSGFVDSSPEKADTTLRGLPVHNLDTFRFMANAELRPFVVIGSMYSAEIRATLLDAGMRETEDFTVALARLSFEEMLALIGRPAVPSAGGLQKEKAPRCLMFYPWNLNESIGALRLFLSYCRALKSAGYRLDCFAPRSAPGSMVDGLYHGIFENVFVMPDRESPVTRHLESFGSLCEDPQLPDKVGRDEASMVAAGVLVSISDYDVVGIQYTRCHSLKQMLPAAMPVVLFTHDLDALVCRQEERIFGYPAEYRLEDEVSRLKPFQLVTVVGPDDRRTLESVDRELPIVVAPFTSEIADRVPVHENSAGVLLCISSAGPFHRFSFMWFWKNVWPKVRAARPECRLVIAGRLSEVALEAGAGADSQISVLGVVDDVEPLYREADVVIAPYYFGLGIKTKVIEALGKGIPVATTTLGIYNTHIQPGRDAIVSDDASEYADQVIQLISCPALRRDIAENGLEYVRRWHNPQTALSPFVEAFDRTRLARTKAAKPQATALRELRDPLRYLVPWTISRCWSDGVRTVAFYGAGSHTRLLIPIWKGLGGPAIHEIIVSGEPSQSTFMGFPVVSVDHFDPSPVDAIVLSSHGYEREMARLCGERWPQLKVYPIWRPLAEPSLTPSEDFHAICHEKIPAELYEM
jgi:ubiquinone/menaquinone biosynthesis C-methylase UbiE